MHAAGHLWKKYITLELDFPESYTVNNYFMCNNSIENTVCRVTTIPSYSTEERKITNEEERKRTKENEKNRNNSHLQAKMQTLTHLCASFE